MYDLGDTVPLAVTIRDANGALADPGTLTLTIQLPDLTTVTPTPVKDSTGLYHYDYAPSVGGTFIARWVGTGPAVAYEQTFTVRAAFDRALVSLEDLKAHLNKTSTADDEELRDTIIVASDFISSITGPVLPTATTEIHRPTSDVIWLKESVVSITSVTEYPRARAISAQSGLVSSGDYYLRDGQELTRRLGYSRYPWAPEVVVVYNAGISPVPARIRQATRELAKHLWQTQRGTVSQYRQAEGVEWSPGQGFSMPRRVEELLAEWIGGVS